MADNKEKTYTPKEMADAVLAKCEELYKNSKLAKANTSHELETGGEPSNDDSEAPEQLQVGEVTKPGQGEQKNKKKKNADGSDMEYEEGDEESAEGEVPEHEEGMDAETKAAHDATESESDAEEAEADEDVAAQEADEADADKIEDKEEKNKDKKEDKKEDKKPPFAKSEKMTKSLFKDQCVKVSEAKYKKTKEDCFYDIKWCLEKLQKMKELKWTIEDEAPEAKDIFEKEYKKEKAKLGKYIKEYNSMKKSEEFDEEEVETLTKAEKVIANRPNKLKTFMDKKALKKKA